MTWRQKIHWIEDCRAADAADGIPPQYRSDYSDDEWAAIEAEIDHAIKESKCEDIEIP